VRPYLEKNSSQKRAGRASGVVECPPSNHEALSSFPSSAKQKECLMQALVPPVILVTQDVEIRGISALRQPRQIVRETLSFVFFFFF
jgi:hypothetical protein